MTPPRRPRRRDDRVRDARRARAFPIALEALEGRALMTLGGNQLFPSDNPWNQAIAAAPVAANSSAIINNIISVAGKDGRIHPDFGQDYGSGSLYGIPYNIVHGNTTPRINVVVDDYASESDIVPVPMPANPVIEGDQANGPTVGAGNRGDSHLIVYDVDNNVAYELFYASRPSENSDGKYHAAQESVWNLAKDSFRPQDWTSADAAGLPILPGLVRPDEGLPASEGGQGAINHAIRFTLPNSIILDQFVYPASHTANSNTNAAIEPAMGTRFRLKAGVDISGLSPESQVIAQAMKTYGLILADNGSSFFFSGASASVQPDGSILTWNDSDIQDQTHGLKSLTYSDFEVVDTTPVVSGLAASTAQAGSSVTVTGQNFSGAAGQLQVYFGTAAATNVVVVDDSHVTATVPSGTGTVDVRVQSGVNTGADSRNIKSPIFGYGTSAVSTADRFTYSTANQPPTVADPGFEAVVVGPGQYAYDPSGSPWSFASSAGITGNKSGFTSGNPAAPQGTQVAFLQDTGSISQSIPNWSAGNFTVTFQAAQRGNIQSSAEDFAVTVDGKVVGTFKPAGSSYLTYTTAAFAVAAGAHTVAFVGLDTAGGDNTAFIDSVTVALPVAGPTTPTVVDPGFESVAVGPGNYAYDPSGSPWTYASSAGITGNNSGFTSGNPAAPQGTQVAFLQDSGSISQLVQGFSAANYTVTFQAAQRGNIQASAEDFAVTLDGKVVGTFKPSGSSYLTYTTAAFAVAAGAHTVAFVGLDTAGGDNTAFIDSVGIAVATSPTVPTAADPGFEQVAVGAGVYVYDPSGSPWSFASSAGITGNNSGFTSGNPAAPQGSQVAFLQDSGSISQLVQGFSAANYTVSFEAAQRGNIQASAEDFAVTLDGKVVGTFKPAGSSYLTYTTAAFAVAAGAHTVAFVGLDTAGGDNTALIDSVAINSA